MCIKNGVEMKKDVNIELENGEILMLLVKSSITGEKYTLPEELSLDDIFYLSQRHSIVPLVYIGLINCGIDKENCIMKNMLSVYCNYLIKSEIQMKAVEQLFDVFEKNNVCYMPLKGCKLKSLYANPELRAMGDADILIKREQYPKIEILMNNLGYVFDSAGDHDYAWKSDKLFVELHYKLFPDYSTAFTDFFSDGWKLATNNNGCYYSMNIEDEFIYIFVHYAKHYRNGGIGFRQVIDLWLYMKTHINMDFSYINKIMVRLNLVDFYHNTMKLIDYWFNGGEKDSIVCLMANYIINSGNWGTIEMHAKAKGVVSAQNSGSSLIVGRFKAIIRIFFPSYNDIKMKYPVLKTHKYLLPAIWIFRWVDSVIKRPKNFKVIMNEVNILSKEDVSSLEYHFKQIGLIFQNHVDKKMK